MATLNPNIAAEFHPKKNRALKATSVTYASNKKVRWLCSKFKHEWQASVSDRTVSEAGCPACYEAAMAYARNHPPERKRGHVVLGDSKISVSRAWYEGNHSFIPLSKSHKAIAKQWHYIFAVAPIIKPLAMRNIAPAYTGQN